MTANKPPVIVVVDPFSSGNQIAPAARARGYEVICVCTYEQVPAFYNTTFDREGFTKLYQCQDGIVESEFDALINALREQGVIAVIAGCETGVVATDRIANALGLAGNDPTTSRVRRSKYLMHETLKKHQLRHISQLLTKNKDELLSWALAHDYNVVLKPVDSAGTNGVHICRSKGEVSHAFDAILSMENIFELPITEVLAQVFVGGIEYVVDTVSCQGEHVVTNICQYHKQELNGSMLYRQVDFIAPDDKNYQTLVDYCLNSLDALGVVHGAAHSEIKIDHTGPVLIETGARLQGSNVPGFVADFADFSQLDLLLDAYLEQPIFVQKARDGNKYHKCAKIFGFINQSYGKLEKVEKSLVTALSSHYSSVFQFQQGDCLSPTTSMLDSPGWVFLLNSEQSAVDSDIESLLDMESTSQVFQLVEEAI